jgi:hypothetical protein
MPLGRNTYAACHKQYDCDAENEFAKVRLVDCLRIAAGQNVAHQKSSVIPGICMRSVSNAALALKGTEY